MQLSQRAQSIKPSSTLAVTARAKQLRAEGVDILSFAAGEPDFDTPEPIKQALVAALKEGMTKYQPVPGDPETRRVIAEKLTRENEIPGVTPDHVVISTGGKQSLYLTFQCLLDPPADGDPPQEVLLPTPGWVTYAPQIELAGGQVVELPTGAAEGFKISPDQLEKAITPRSRAVVFNSPSNPCGTMYTPEEIEALARVITDASDRAPDLVVVSDEIYERIVYGGFPFKSFASCPGMAERTITVNGLAKAFSMTGWRVGYLGASGDAGLQFAKAVGRLQSQMTSNITSFCLPAVRVAIQECSEDATRMCEAFARRSKLIYGLVSELPGLLCPKPTGAFYVFPDVSAHFGKTTKGGARVDSAASFAAALLDEEHVAVVPGEDFLGCGERCVRLSFACSDDQIRSGIERIGGFLESLS